MNIDLERFFINKNASIQDALKAITDNSSKCLFVVNSKKIMLGSLSDGDIRREILKGKKLSYKISTIFNKEPKFLFDKSYTITKAQNLFLKHLVDIIPIIDEKKCTIMYI